MNLKLTVPKIGILKIYMLPITVYYIIILIFGRSNPLMGALSWLVAGIWFVLTIRNVSKTTNLPNMAFTTLLMVLLIFYLSAWDLMKYGMISFVSSFCRYFSLFLPFYMFAYTIGRNHNYMKKHIKQMLFIYTILSVAQCVLYITADDPEYARNIVGTDRGYFAFIADAYGLCQAAAFLAVAGFICMYKKKKKALMITFFILNNIIIILTKSTLIILCYVAAMAFLIVNFIFDHSFMGRIKKKYMRLIVKMALCIIGFLIILCLAEWLGYFFISMAAGKSGVVASRFRELGALLTERNLSIDLTARFAAYTTSFQTALTHPLFGNYSAYSIGAYDVIGGHSEVIDMAARYGFPVTIAYFGLVYYFLKSEIKLMRIRIPGLIILYSLFIIVNPFNYSIAYFALFYIAPLMVYINKNREKCNVRGISGL